MERSSLYLMDSVLDSSAKRRKMQGGPFQAQGAHNLPDISSDELSKEDEAYETVATVPVARLPSSQQLTTQQLSSPPPPLTQPTQIIQMSTPKPGSTGRTPSIVQVAASSPLRPPADTSPTTSRKPVGIFATSMAPAGTAFRPPFGVRAPPPKPPVIDISDEEGPVYRGGSSDEDSQVTRRANIKPSVFVSTAKGSISEVKGSSGVEESPNPAANRFREITANSFYKPLEKAIGASPTLKGSVYDSRNRDDKTTKSRIAAPAKRSADVLANAYGGSSRPTKQVRQAGPARAQPVQDISLDDIEDYQLRTKVKRMLDILPNTTVLLCKNALIHKRGNFDDAMDLLTSEEEHRIEVDLTLSDTDRPIKQSVPPPRKPTAKQQVKAPARTIQDKWASSQAVPKPSASAPQPSTSTPPKPRRKLVQGRKKPSLPPSPAAAQIVKPPPPHSPEESEDSSDSGVQIESEDDPELDGKVLKFFNTCSVNDLADIASIPAEIAETIISRKPFASLDKVRQVTKDPETKTKSTGTRKVVKKPIGEKVVAKCLEMWTGYEAVDQLVNRCDALGKPVAEEMKKWGVDVFGAAKNGELELVSFDDLKIASKQNSQASVRDSGLGTPSSAAQSAEEDNVSQCHPSAGSRSAKSKSLFFGQPAIMAEDVKLKDYQVVGVNWLSLLYKHGLSCILADDMGLGKTCQVIAFLAHLFENGSKGPHLVVVPGSTLENWLREFSIFCPTLTVVPYYAGQAERANIREVIEENKDINVIVTTYGMAKARLDNKFLRRRKFDVCVYDEGHQLKNRKSAGYDQLMKIPARFRLLLTGTPLQNNLSELASLLGFILPSVFAEHEADLEYVFSHRAKTSDENHAALLSAQRIAKARSMMAPFVLRRKKHQVLKHLPTKTRRVEYCDLTTSQYDIYVKDQERARRILQLRSEGSKSSSKERSNVMMSLRKAAIHPLLFRRIYTDDILRVMSEACLSEPEYAESNVDLVFEDMSVMTDFELHTFCDKHPNSMSSFTLRNDEWMDSGKVSKLCELLQTFKAEEDRVLIFSQFTMVMNILETVLETLGIRFFRLDGSTRIDERQDMLDEFYEDRSITVFLLSTKAGGAGINLACANKVVIFDSSFNPQEDVQAENRAHRVGQTREVEVVRLVTRSTIEEQIYALGQTKLALDDRVAGEADPEGMDVEDGKKAEQQGAKLVEEMMIEQLKMGEGVNKETES